MIGPSTQQNIVQSADGIDTTVIFKAGFGFLNSTSVSFNISNDDVALEELESYNVVLRLPEPTTGIRLGNPSVTTVNILDEDGKCYYARHTLSYLLKCHSLIPRLLPDFISKPWILLHSCKI